MNLGEDIVSEVIKDGVKITTYKNGRQYFEIVEKEKPASKLDNRSWWQKLKTWWDNTLVKPYIKVRDLADPFGDREDPDAGSDGKPAIETGLKINF